MSEYYYELIIKPENHFELFTDLIVSLTNEAIEEFDGTIIARSEEDLSDIEFGVNEFAKAININCNTELTKKREY